MDVTTIIVTVVCCVAAVGYTLIAHQRAAGARRVVRGIGLVLLPIGLLVAGVMALLVGGVRHLYHWLMSTVFDLQHQIGLGITVLALVVLVASSFMSRRTRAEAKQVRAARRGSVAGASAKSVTGRPAQPTATDSGKLSDEDAEIEAILRNHGIQ